ncbi:MAG TPA: hemolysin III family protein [Gemmatimonadales bacterium]|nr:hemolysin III family protein [Gemmatimonadales bacterium]
MHRAQSRGEEIANSVSHGVGFVAAVAVLPVLAVNALQHGSAALVGALVFGVSAVLLYLTSTLYHALTPARAKQIFRVLDHGAIYLLIAGTYTPFMLGVLRGPIGWSLLGAVWVLAIFGIVLKARGGIRYPRFSTALYLGMGWLIIVAAKPFLEAVPVPGLLWLAAGGLAYTAGVGFYAASRLPYRHFVWHLFVLAGTACHVVAVLRYAA